MTFYRMNEIKLHIGEKESRIPEIILKKLGSKARGMKVLEYRIVKQSIDARDKGDILIVYSVDFAVSGKLNLQEVVPAEYILPPHGDEKLEHRPVVCGFGPAGMFAGLILADAGMRPIIIERGADMEHRTEAVERFWRDGILDTECNVQFGEGGAGTFSDGKLTTNIKDPRISKVLSEFVMAGADESIMYRHKPHIGTDILRTVVVNIREKILKLGGEIIFNAKLTDIKTDGGRLNAITIQTDKSGENLKVLDTECLVLAPGHSARDTFRMLCEKGINMQQKPFSIGVRIQHPQELINRAQYGTYWEELDLPPAEYKLSYHCKESGRGVYTFCMCPGGEVISASSQEGGVVTNGMSYNARDGKFANSALLVDVRTEDFGSSHPLAGVDFQEKYEKLAFTNGGSSYKPPTARWDEFSDTTNKNGERVRNSIPDFAYESMLEAMPSLAKKLRGFDDGRAVLFAVESRSSSPVRILRDEEYNSSLKGIYPAGEGAGYAGGIVSAAVDGIRIAEAIISKYKVVE